MSSKLESDVCCRLQVAPSGERYEGKRRPGRKQRQTIKLLGIWRDSLHVTCGLTACTPGSVPGPTLGNEYGKTLPSPFTDKMFSLSPAPVIDCTCAYDREAQPPPSRIVSSADYRRGACRPHAESATDRMPPGSWASAQMGSADPPTPGKMDEKLKSENMQKRACLACSGVTIFLPPRQTFATGQQS